MKASVNICRLYHMCGQNPLFQWVISGLFEQRYLKEFVLNNRKRLLKVVADEL